MGKHSKHIFWSVIERVRVYEEMQRLKESGRLKEKRHLNWHFAQSILPKSSHRDWKPGGGSITVEERFYDAWVKGGLAGLQAAIKANSKSTGKRATVKPERQPGPVRVLVGDAAAMAIGIPTAAPPTADPDPVAPPMPDAPKLSFEGAFAELIARAALQSFMPMASDMQANMNAALEKHAADISEMLKVHDAALETRLQKHAADISEMLKVHDAVIEGMFDDHYKRVYSFLDSQTAPASQKAEGESLITVSKVTTETVGTAIGAHPKKVLRIFLDCYPNTFGNLKKNFAKVEKTRGFSLDLVHANGSHASGHYDLVVGTGMTSHSDDARFKRDYEQVYRRLPQASVSNITLLINELIARKMA